VTRFLATETVERIGKRCHRCDAETRPKVAATTSAISCRGARARVPSWPRGCSGPGYAARVAVAEVLDELASMPPQVVLRRDPRESATPLNPVESHNNPVDNTEVNQTYCGNPLYWNPALPAMDHRRRFSEYGGAPAHSAARFICQSHPPNAGDQKNTNTPSGPVSPVEEPEICRVGLTLPLAAIGNTRMPRVKPLPSAT